MRETTLVRLRQPKIVYLGGFSHETTFDPDGVVRVHIRDAREIVIPDTWEEVRAIKRTRGVTIKSERDLHLIIESPLLRAVQHLYRSGIQTLESNAHFEPFELAVDGIPTANITLTISEQSLREKDKMQNAQRLVELWPDVWFWRELGDQKVLHMKWKIYKTFSPWEVSEQTERWARMLTA